MHLFLNYHSKLSALTFKYLKIMLKINKINKLKKMLLFGSSCWRNLFPDTGTMVSIIMTTCWAYQPSG